MAWIWSDLLSAGTGLIGSLLQNSSNSQENQRNRDFNALEAEKQRQWQGDEWSRQFDMQRSEWYNQLYAQQDAAYKQFLREAEYNSPKNQVTRMAEAGLNPSAVLGGQGSSGLVSAATGNVHSAPSPSIPSGGTVSGASASAPSPIPMQNPLSGLQSVGSFLRDAAQATKDKTLLDPMIRLMTSQIYGQDLQNSLLETENFIKRANMPASIGKAYAEYQKELMDITLKRTIDENYKADTLVKKAEQFLKNAQAKVSGEEFKILEFQVTHQLETWQADMDVKRSEKSRNYASGRLSVALAASEDQIRLFKTYNQVLLNEYQEYHNKIEGNEANLNTLLKDEKYQALLVEFKNRAKQAGLLTGKMNEELEKAQKENNWWLFEHVLLPVYDRLRPEMPDKRVERLTDKVIDVLK